MTQKYNVHLFPIVRVKVTDIEAESQTKAIEKAEETVDYYHLFGNLNGLYGLEVEHGEEVSHYLVDEVGDEEFRNSRWYGPDGESDLFHPTSVKQDLRNGWKVHLLVDYDGHLNVYIENEDKTNIINCLSGQGDGKDGEQLAERYTTEGIEAVHRKETGIV